MLSYKEYNSFVKVTATLVKLGRITEKNRAELIDKCFTADDLLLLMESANMTEFHTLATRHANLIPHIIDELLIAVPIRGRWLAYLVRRIPPDYVYKVDALRRMNSALLKGIARSRRLNTCGTRGALIEDILKNNKRRSPKTWTFGPVLLRFL